ncbi:pyridoxamine 5'-phosphate oxidase family protein [uncultured Robinsoniella sp.]|uniref:pyridoxamine 5'-phosphate oxidase family protein n=1 Tax=uncultured Robinsoniella sp. TaxID=904190 RepID=UPI00374F247D
MSYYIGTVAEMPDKLKKETERFITEHKDAVILGTRQGDDVHLTIMGFLSGISLNMLYMQTNIQSQKVSNINSNSLVEIAITNDSGGVVLTCEAEVVEDEKMKSEKWEDWMFKYHDSGHTSPSYVLLRFVPQFVKLILIEC